MDEVIDNRQKLSPAPYIGLISFLNADGGLYMPYLYCKELVIKYFSGNHLLPGDTTLWWCRSHTGAVNLDKPQFVISGRTRAPNLSFESVRRAMDLLSSRMNEKIDVQLISGTNLIVITTSRFFARSSVSMHGLLTVARGALKLRNLPNTIDEFFRIVSDEDSADAEQIIDAGRNGNLDGFLNKSLVAQNAPRFDSWIGGYEKHFGRLGPTAPGIVSYRDDDKPEAILTAELIKKWFPNGGMTRKYGHGWEASYVAS